MNPRISLFTWILLLHLVILAGVYLLVHQHPVVFFAAEGLVVVSMVGIIAAFRRITAPAKQVAEGISRIAENDFSVRLQPTGDPMTDRLVDFYNRMMDQLRTERARIRSQHHFLDLLIKASPLGIILMDFDQQITEANPAACRFLGIDENVSWRINPPKPEGQLADAITAIPEGDTRTLRINGIQQFRIRKLMFTDRGFPHPFVLIEELTDEINRAEKESYTRIIRMMSHEVNNTVGAINSILESVESFLGENQGNAGVYADAIRVAIGRNDAMNRFMANFAGVVRLPQPVLNSCNINQLLLNVITLCQPWAGARNIEIRAGLSGELQPVQADATMLEQALINALKNAIEASENGGTVMVGSSAHPPRLVIRNGGGVLTPEIQQKLFTPFFSTKPSGQGIGLMLIREIMTRHQFRFSLEPDGDGLTEFTVWLH